MQLTKNDIMIRLLQHPERSFFLFGPRGTGKSTWLQQVLPDAFMLDLLDASLFLELTRDPHRLEALIGGRAADGWIVLDEIPKVPPPSGRSSSSHGAAEVELCPLRIVSPQTSPGRR